MNKLLREVVRSLETVKCSGYDNWNTLVGCINAIHTVADALDAALTTKEEGGKEGSHG